MRIIADQTSGIVVVFTRHARGTSYQHCRSAGEVRIDESHRHSTQMMGTALRRLFDKTDYDTIVDTLLALGAMGASTTSMPAKLIRHVPYSILRNLLEEG